jgi:sensor histidine kinase YesM
MKNSNPANFLHPKLSYSTLFYLLNGAGWLVYGGLIIFVYLNSFQPIIIEKALINTLGTCGVGFLLTNFIRYIAGNQGWTEKSFPVQILFIIPTSIISGMLFVAFSFLIDYLNPLNEDEIRWIYLVLGVINSSILFLVWQLLYFITKNFRKIRLFQLEQVKNESAIKDFELNNLKSQLNPHFVFNALNIIRALVDEDPAKAKQSINKLSNILRSSLSAAKNKTIPFKDEFQTIQDYLELEKLRYEDRLNIITSVPNEVLSVQVPPMMVQTLVENAVKHGIIKVVNHGFISLTAKLIGDFLHITITNSGTLGKLDSGGLGVINTRQRLEILYPKNHSFEISQSQDNEVTVNLTIPIQI